MEQKTKCQAKRCNNFIKIYGTKKEAEYQKTLGKLFLCGKHSNIMNQSWFFDRTDSSDDKLKEIQDVISKGNNTNKNIKYQIHTIRSILEQ